MFITKRDLNDFFDRLRKLETKESLSHSDKKNIARNIKEFKDDFKNHDKEEMKKYDKIQLSLDKLNRDRNYLLGAFIFYEILHKFGYISV